MKRNTDSTDSHGWGKVGKEITEKRYGRWLIPFFVSQRSSSARLLPEGRKKTQKVGCAWVVMVTQISQRSSFARLLPTGRKKSQILIGRCLLSYARPLTRLGNIQASLILLSLLHRFKIETKIEFKNVQKGFFQMMCLLLFEELLRASIESEEWRMKSEESFLFMSAWIKQSFHDCHLKEWICVICGICVTLSKILF